MKKIIKYFIFNNLFFFIDLFNYKNIYYINEIKINSQCINNILFI